MPIADFRWPQTSVSKREIVGCEPAERFFGRRGVVGAARKTDSENGALSAGRRSEDDRVG
jgi:hypothetical protein